jgi:hypothetical protein
MIIIVLFTALGLGNNNNLYNSNDLKKRRQLQL